ncbi:MAG: hypothetical protein WBM69_12820 [Desulfobacterales bacterium]
MIERKADVDNNVRMVIFGHSNPNDMDLRYDTLDQGDMIDAIDKNETFLKNSHNNTKKLSILRAFMA